MPIIECQSREEYLSKVGDLTAAKRKIISVELYWYEGAGKRVTKIPPGPAVKAMWSGLTLEERIKVAFSMMSSDKYPPGIQELVKQCRECVRKDYETESGYQEVEGAPEDAVIVIDYE